MSRTREQKDAFNARMRQWRRDNPEAASRIAREASKRRRAKVKAQMMDLYGGKCAHCGFVDQRILQLDHINGGGRQDHLRTPGGQVYVRAVKLALEGDFSVFQLLCPNCNWLKRLANENEQPSRRAS